MMCCRNRDVLGGWGIRCIRSGGKQGRRKVKPDMKDLAGHSFKKIKYVNISHIFTV